VPAPPPAPGPVDPSRSPSSTLAGARDEFDLPDDVAYLDCASMGPLPKRATEAGWSGIARKGRPWIVAVDDFTVPVDQLREAFADLLGVPDDGDGVAITPSVSYGVATAAANLELAPGQGVLVLERQFPSDVLGWAALAARHDGELHVVARPDDGDWTAAVRAELDRLGDRVGAVSVPPCHWIDGGVVDLAAVVPAARAQGAAVAIDATQWLGAAPLDVAALRPDFVVGATSKWLCGPYSMGFCWVAPEHRDGTPIEHGWANRFTDHRATALAGPVPGWRPGARRFDVGEVAHFALVPAALAALDVVAAWDAGELVAHTRARTAQAAEGASALGLSVDPPHLRAPHLIGIRGDTSFDASSVAAALADEGVHVSGMGDTVRVSAHAFTTTDDVDHLLAALGRALGRSR
jgi:selenocysteine lyase/cysteine desulfurase